MTAAPTQAVVRVKVARNAFTSPLMPLDEAKEKVEEIRKAVYECGDGWWFVKFTGFDGREVHIRAREVVAIEYVPDLPDRVKPPAASYSSVGQAAFTVTGPVVEGVPGGTAFLRRMAGMVRDELAAAERGRA